MDISTPESRRFVWYKSVNAEEPRRGPSDEIEWAHNLGLDLPRLAQELDGALLAADPRQSSARLLLARPELRVLLPAFRRLMDSVTIRR